MSQAALELSRLGRPVVNIDVAGVVSQFLGDLSLFDIVVEIVQNDLDAGAKCTEIEFGETELVCVGNGNAIDASGWKRLAYVLGAGSEVQAKQDGIGSKNHGLRAAFLLGDQIVVQSGGQRIDLTVRGSEERPDTFFPAVWPKLPDPGAPKHGVRITIPYRTRQLEVPERNPLGPIDAGYLDRLFDDATLRAADRFICASAPGRSWRYELVLARGARRVKYLFECAPVGGKRGLWLRTCRRSSSSKAGRPVANRLCSPFPIKLDSNDHAKVPRLYRRAGKIVGELSWPVDRDLAPVPNAGGYRYPIAYPKEHIDNGWGFDISGPFVSGRARHSMSDDDRNDLIKSIGRKAFVAAAPSLVAMHGPRALALASNDEKRDQAAERDLAAELVSVGAIAIVAGKGFKLADPSEPILFAAASHAPAQLSRPLAKLAATTGQALHSETPQPFVEALLCLSTESRDSIVPFSEQDAARTVFGTQEPFNSQQFETWVANCVTALRALEVARLEGVLPPDFLKSVRADAWLPTTERKAAEWNSIYRSAKPPPAVPGVTEPKLLHAALFKSSILREGIGKVRPFKLDDHLANLNFKSVSPEGRTRFFRWFRRGYPDVSPARRAEIATYPIWPARNGSFHALDDFCLPRQAYLRVLLEEICPAPSDDVIRFPGLRSASNSSLRLRKTPKPSELAAWHAARMATLVALAQDDLPRIREHVSTTENALIALRGDGFPLGESAKGHKTLSAAGEVVEVQQLHIVARQVEECALLPQDLAAGPHGSLYASLSAHTRPTEGAILRALRANSSWETLFPRLQAYRATGRDLSELASETIVPVSGTLRAPVTLSFPSTTDWWGQWKTSLDRSPDVPEQVALLESCGVVRAALREELSRDFFAWIASQSATVQREHRQQIVRHWADRRHGPSRWAERYAERQCIPVYDKNGAMELRSQRAVASVRSLVFVPDFEAIQADVQKHNARVRLTVTGAKGVDGSIIDALKSVGVRSLRAFSGQPTQLSSASLATNAELEAEFSLLKARKTLIALQERLELHDVPATALRHGWRRMIQDLKAVRTTPSLSAIFNVLGREYAVEVASGVDLPSLQVCVADQSDRKMAFYSALGSHIFVAGSSELFEYGLMKAVHSNVVGKHFDELDSQWHLDVDPEPASESTGGGGSGNTHGTPQKGHGISNEESVPVVPQPGALKPIITPTFTKQGNTKTPKRRPVGRTDQVRGSVEEEEHILSLKSKHYAWHCQACLGERDVLQLTPPRSYVYLPLHRRGLIEAHHVQHLQNEVLLGAANLLILCRFHHHTLGDQLSRALVLEALANSEPLIRHFPGDDSGLVVTVTSGVLASPCLTVENEAVRLFFTMEHKAAWEEVGRVVSSDKG